MQGKLLVQLGNASHRVVSGPLGWLVGQQRTVMQEEMSRI